jgi:hypothetical protein
MRMPSMQFELKIMAGGIYLGLYARQDHGVNGQLSRIRGGECQPSSLHLALHQNRRSTLANYRIWVDNPSNVTYTLRFK